ncbi:MAG: response regulator [Nitrospinae bacterium]|nr:response regulator [Nitrospinota bacterium]
METPLKILIVEDAPGMALLCRKAVEGAGYEASVAETGEAALNRLEQNGINLVLLDQELPDMAGTEVLERMIEKKYDTPVIMVTGHGDENLATKSLKLGARDYVVKDARLDYLKSLPEVIAKTYRQLLLERRLHESEERFRIIASTANDAIIMADENGKASYWNPAAERIFGFSAAEIIGRELSGFIIPDRFYDGHLKGFRQFKSTGAGPLIGATVELAGLRKNGEEFPLELSVASIRIGDNWHAVGTIRDITERKKLESQIRQKQKMEAIGALAGGIAHDFNNILTGIIGYTEIAMDELPEESQARGDLEQVFKAGQRAKDLVAHILAFSRQSEKEMKPIQFHLILKEALKLLRASLPSNIEIREKIDKEADVVMADPTQMHQVIVNLCTNAAHAMREKGGVMEVILQPFEVDGMFSRSHANLKPGSHLRLSVSDTGHGMEKAILERIFEPFFTTKQKDGGSGMGLAAVYGIVQSHSGAINAYSEPGKGSVFHVYLPRIEKDEKMDAMEIRPVPRGTERVLIVDDEEMIIQMGQKILAGLGYRTQATTSGLEALELFRADPFRFDLVITDQTMPKITGEALAGEMLRIRPDLPIILCTGFSYVINEEKAKAMGIREFVMKPLLVRELAEAVRRALDGEKNRGS